PCSSSREQRMRSSPAWPSAWRLRSATTPPSPSWRAPATPPTSSSRTASSRSSDPGSPPEVCEDSWSLRTLGRHATKGPHRRRAVSGADPEAGGEEGAGHELDPAGGAEHRDERGTRGALEHLDHRR